MNVACNRLIGLGGKDEGNGPWLVEVDDRTGMVKGISPLDGMERSFTQWLGGTIIISSFNRMEPSVSCQPLSQWIALLSSLSEDESADWHQGYAWHLPVCQPEASVACPRLITISFIL